MSAPINSYTCALDAAQAKKLRELLLERSWKFREAPHTTFACQKEGVSVAHYLSGKLVAQGKGTQDFVQFVLEPEVLGRATLGYETVANPELAIPRIGVDESGKGDLFGPLCAAAVYANESIVKDWIAAGVRDSKQISSPKSIEKLNDLIRATPGAACSVVPIGNPAYNRLYEKIGNLNRLLAWAHGRAIEDLLERHPGLAPPPVRIVVDQFARDPRVVQSALQKRGRQLELIQRTKAESDPVVAAASILARHAYVSRLEGLEKSFGVRLPKGASAQVREAVGAFVALHGRQKLGEVAKLHFSNAGSGPVSGPEASAGPARIDPD
ncbi:MAG: ribonuclease HIII [Verrucomicrobia bacterium]|nr:ribonuclease HIII [Verrucomicrobiota bacterium]